METEKDKHHPEKSHSFTTRDATQENNNDDHENNHHHNNSDPNLNLHPEKDPNHNNNNNNNNNDNNDDTTNEANSESQTEPEPNLENTEVEKKEEGQEEEEDATGVTPEEESHPPPDFDQVCQEIDQFISALSTAKGGDADPPELPEAMEHFPFLVEAKIANYDSPESPMKWNQLSEEDSSLFLETVDRVSKLMTSLTAFSSQSNFAPSINHIGGILQRAMSYLEDEFRSLLEDPRIPDFNNKINESKAKQSSSSWNSNQEEDNSPAEEPKSTEEDNFPGYSDEVLSDLNRLAKSMVTGGYEAECYQVYIVTRRTVLEETLHKMGFEKFSVDDIQKMQWEQLEKVIISWNNTFKQCVGVLFNGERKLTAAVFDGDGKVDGLFSSVTTGILIQLLNFAAAVGMTKRSSDKLFKFLDIYETLRDIAPAMDELFAEGTANELKSEASLTRTRLGEAMVGYFCELENSIKADTGKTPVAGGAVHPLTRYTMNYLQCACAYKDTLEQIFREHQQIERADSATGSDFDYNSQSGGGSSSSSSSTQNQVNQTSSVKLSPFSIQINKVMDLLDMNIEAKSKLYRDPLLSLIFMMNNWRYTKQKVKGSEMNELMGDAWSRKRQSDIMNYFKRYRESWGRLLNCLSHDGLTVHGKVVKPVLKERFKSFNAMFDEIHKTQSTWVVSDDQLQSELRVSISSVVIQAYRAFLARFSQSFTPGRQTEKYIKYQVEDIETYIDELFDGNKNAAQGKKRP